MHERPWHRLDLDIFAALDKDVYQMIAESLSTECAKSKETIAVEKISWRSFNSDFLQSLYRHNLLPENLLIFYRKPAAPSIPHVDMYEDGTDRKCVYAINQILNDDHSYMRWFHVKRDRDDPTHSSFGRYQVYDETELIEFDQCRIGQEPTLVRTDIPHDIVMGDTDRICLSLRIKDDISCWENAVEFFQPFIKKI